MKSYVVFDCRVFQTPAWSRGMGEYTRNIVREYSAANTGECAIVLDKSLYNKERHEEIIAYFDDDISIKYVENVDEVQVFIDTIVGRTVTFLVAAPFLFQFEIYWPTHCKRAVIFYDFTPLLYWKELGMHFPGYLYFTRFKYLIDADIVFSISEYVKKQLVMLLPVTEDKVFDLHSAIRTDENTSLKTPRYKKRGEYVLLPTGGSRMIHKNNKNAVDAFIRMVKEHRIQSLVLLATSTYTAEEKKWLTSELKDKSRVVFTGDVSSEEKTELYKNAKAVVLPSLEEGLGLPVFEALRYRVPVACSAIEVFEEIGMSKNVADFFDPVDIDSISTALYGALNKKRDEQFDSECHSICDKFDWSIGSSIISNKVSSTYYSAQSSKKKILNGKSVVLLCADPRKSAKSGLLAQIIAAQLLKSNKTVKIFIDSGDVKKDASESVYPDYIRTIGECYDIGDIYREPIDLNHEDIVICMDDDEQYSTLQRLSLANKSVIIIPNWPYDNVLKSLHSKKLISDGQWDVDKLVSREKGITSGISFIGVSRSVITSNEDLFKVKNIKSQASAVVDNKFSYRNCLKASSEVRQLIKHIERTLLNDEL